MAEKSGVPTMKLTSIAAFAATAIFASALVNADNGPRLNADPNRHPNLFAAQDLSRQAFEKIREARSANDGEPGHLAKAMDALIVANQEIAAAVANR
jgi:hypothetical protein